MEFQKQKNLQKRGIKLEIQMKNSLIKKSLFSLLFHRYFHNNFPDKKLKIFPYFFTFFNFPYFNFMESAKCFFYSYFYCCC
jgi:hypothetical protein